MPIPKTKECDVCGGDGRCPIHDVHGYERYWVRCPECYGIGIIDDETGAAQDNAGVMQEVG